MSARDVSFLYPFYPDLLHKINFLAGSDKKPSPYRDKAAVPRLPCLPPTDRSCIFFFFFLGGCQITQTGMGTVRKCHFVCLGAGDNKTTVTLIRKHPTTTSCPYSPLHQPPLLFLLFLVLNPPKLPITEPLPGSV